MDTTVEKDIYKTSRGLHIIEAAVEYFITILIGGAYLAKLTDAVGISDAMTGIFDGVYLTWRRHAVCCDLFGAQDTGQALGNPLADFE